MLVCGVAANADMNANINSQNVQAGIAHKRPIAFNLTIGGLAGIFSFPSEITDLTECTHSSDVTSIKGRRELRQSGYGLAMMVQMQVMTDFDYPIQGGLQACFHLGFGFGWNEANFFKLALLERFSLGPVVYFKWSEKSTSGVSFAIMLGQSGFLGNVPTAYPGKAFDDLAFVLGFHWSSFMAGVKISPGPTNFPHKELSLIFAFTKRFY